jgi:hypothetical protein
VLSPVGELRCAITVDDIIFGGSTKAIDELFISKMKSQFKLTHEDSIERVLGLDIVECSNALSRTITIDTQQLVEDLAADHGLEGLPPVDNPTPSNPSYHEWSATNTDEATHYLDNKRYRALTGSITYIATVGRPDIAHASAMVSRHNHNPGPKAFAAAKRIVTYLLATKDFKLTYSAQPNNPYPGSDWNQTVRRLRPPRGRRKEPDRHGHLPHRSRRPSAIVLRRRNRLDVQTAGLPRRVPSAAESRVR